MAHDREFQRRRKDTRMPVRDSHGEDQPAARQTEQDFDLRRARDTPSSVNGKTHRQDIPVQTEFSQLSPETPASLLEQGEAYATALDGFSGDFEASDASRTAPTVHRNRVPDTGQRTKQFPAGGFQAFFCNRGCDRP